MSEKVKALTELKTLDGQAATFTLPVTLTRLDGSNVKVIFTCQAHGKRSWSKAKQRHIDKILASKKEQQEQVDADGAEVPVRLEEAIDRAISANAGLVMEFATGWSLTDDFNLKNLEDLEDRFGNTLDQLIKAMDKAVYQGQLGN